MAATSVPFPILWSGSAQWTSDIVVDDPAGEGTAFWHGGASPNDPGVPEVYPYTKASIDALVNDWTYVSHYWPLSEVPVGTGSGAYPAVVGTLDLDAVTAVMPQGALTNLYDDGQGVDFDGTGEISVTNDGSIDFSPGWAVTFAYQPDNLTDGDILFEVHGTDGFRIEYFVNDSHPGHLKLINDNDTEEIFTAVPFADFGYGSISSADFVDGPVQTGQINVITVASKVYSSVINGMEVWVNGERWLGYRSGGGFDPWWNSHANNTKIQIGQDADGDIGWLVIQTRNSGLSYAANGTESGDLHDLLSLVATDFGSFYDLIDQTQTGKPSLKVAVNGELVLEELQHASWTKGKQRWFDDLEPGNASLDFIGLLDAKPGDPVVIYTETDALWAGYVDDVTSLRGEDRNWRTSITAVDVVGRAGKVELEDYQNNLDLTATESEADAHIEQALNEFYVPIAMSRATYYGDDGGYATFINDAYSGDLVSYLNLVAKRGNVSLAQDRFGNLRWTKRQRFAVTPLAVPLAGDDSPSRWDESLTQADIINSFYAEDSSGVVFTNVNDYASQDLYGVKDFSFEAPTTWTAYGGGAYPSTMTTGTKDPRPIVTDGEFYVDDLQDSALLFEPFDLVEQDDVLWQVMGVEHEVDLDTWKVKIAAERDLDYLQYGESEAAGYENPNDVTIDRQEIASTKDAVIRLDKTSLVKTGAGAITYLPVGATGPDGVKYRALIQFNITWPAGFVKVRKARLRLQTSDENVFQHGGDPKIIARRNTNSWTEGTESSLSVSNDTVWGDVKHTRDGETVKRVTGANDTYVYLDVTNIAQGWYDHGNYGLMLRAANEFRTRNRNEFYAEDHSTGDGPLLILECETT